MHATSAVERLFEVSQNILRNNALGNGAIVAANSTGEDYPAGAENYFYSWGRDAAYQIVGAHAAGMPEAADIRRRYVQWLLQRCQGFSATGLLIKRYAPNGAADWRYGMEYQPDQAGTLLWALHETTAEPDASTDRAIRLMANGLAHSWQERHFRQPIQDVWEDQLAEPEQDDVFTYSLAVSAQGLSAAIDRLAHQGLEAERSDWTAARDQMINLLQDEQRPYFYKRITAPGATLNTQLDGSLSGLLYPLRDCYGPELRQRSKATLHAIGRQLCTPPSGMQRYQGDTYDGIVRQDGTKTTAGSWPLLSFWQAIGLNRMGQRAGGLTVYHQTIERLAELYVAGLLRNGHIPEQIFPDNVRQGRGATPLAWAHAKFLIATAELQP